MKIFWDESKRKLVLKKRHIDFAHLQQLFLFPYLEEPLLNNPEQYRIVGFVQETLTTFIIEYREEELEEIIWVVTAWKSTKQEEKLYEEEIKDF
ncbi:MAG: hypothetical protein AABZ60_23580 [Planctomycetota bacterium]